ncbi:MAG: YqgE/AlgH family protein, partial [Thermoanaerobaculia bacterium]|nr:YqgE/AlgH family protein [Thermoanaerobaculia bacterium]
MSDFELSLDPPFFLVAMPQVLDPFFHRTVVVVLEHHSGGSFGYIVNRPTEFSLGELLGGLDIVWTGPSDSIGWFGGPVQPQMGTALFEQPAATFESDEEVINVIDDLHLTADLNVIRKLATNTPERFRLILGYS